MLYAAICTNNDETAVGFDFALLISVSTNFKAEREREKLMIRQISSSKRSIITVNCAVFR
jgi:hypothetical protein